MMSILYLFIFFSFFFQQVGGRSIHRPKSNDIPTISMSYKGDQKQYTLRNWYLEEYPYFKLYNADYLRQFTLPDTMITHRYDPSRSSSGSAIKQTIESLIMNLKYKKKISSDFILLQDKDYNYHNNCGLIVLKFKEHPFVVKLFVENPKSLVDPYNKGIEPTFFFFMGGGVNRHLSGFTRIRNRELVLEKLSQSEKWKGKVGIPRKWFLIPEQNKPIVMKGENIGPEGTPTIEIPSIYCILEDVVEATKYSYSTKPGSLEVCNDLDLMIDPHITNFMIEKKTNKLIIIDTEHFPSVVGLKKGKTFKSYLQWYFHLTSKCIRDMFLRTKHARKKAQKNPDGYYLTY